MKYNELELCMKDLVFLIKLVICGTNVGFASMGVVSDGVKVGVQGKLLNGYGEELILGQSRIWG